MEYMGGDCAAATKGGKWDQQCRYALRNNNYAGVGINSQTIFESTRISAMDFFLLST
jgi:hypothetical protein